MVMKRIWKVLISMLVGAALGAIAILAAQSLIRSLPTLLGGVLEGSKLGEVQINMINRILNGLKDAPVVSPWIGMMVGGAIFGVFPGLVIGKKIWRILIAIILWLLFLLCVFPIAAMVSRVNDLMLIEWLRKIAPILQSMI